MIGGGVSVQMKVAAKPSTIMRSRSLLHHHQFPSSYPQLSVSLSTTRFFPTLLANRNDNTDGDDQKEKENKGGWKLKWAADLVLSPDPDNVAAVGLTGLLTWASVQVLWQLVLISVAIVAAAVKYSLIAAILIFILITLL